jgi:hypothetical protein
MANEVLRARFKVEVLINGFHGVGIEVSPLMSCRVIILPGLQEFKELLGPSFFKESHKRGADGFHLGARHLGDLSITVDKRTGYLLELEITCHIGVNEDLGELAGSDNELGNEIYGVVSVSSQFFWNLLIRPELAIELWNVSGVVATRVCNVATGALRELNRAVRGIPSRSQN